MLLYSTKKKPKQFIGFYNVQHTKTKLYAIITNQYIFVNLLQLLVSSWSNNLQLISSTKGAAAFKTIYFLKTCAHAHTFVQCPGVH